MGIYVFTWSKLKKYLTEDEANPNSENDFGKNVIPAMLAAGEKMWPYRFEGYWRDVGTIKSLWDANMDILCGENIDLFDKKWPIRSNNPISLPQYFGEDAKVTHSIVTGGSQVNGIVESSVLSASVVIEEGALIDHSVIMPGTKICRGAVISYAIIGGNSLIGPGAIIGEAPAEGREPEICTVGPEIKVAAGAKIPAGAMIYEDVKEGGAM